MKIKQLFKSKTMWTSLATICTGIGLYVSGEQNLQELAISIVGVVFGFLRLITEEPISLK